VFNGTWIFSWYLKKIQLSNFMKVHPVWAECIQTQYERKCSICCNRWQNTHGAQLWHLAVDGQFIVFTICARCWTCLFNDGAVCSEGNEFRVKFDFCSLLSMKYHMHHMNSLNLFKIHLLSTQCVLYGSQNRDYFPVQHQPNWFEARSQNCVKQLLASSCPSAWRNSAPTGPNFMKFDIWRKLEHH
jgi:hypothetical protein